MGPSRRCVKATPENKKNARSKSHEMISRDPTPSVNISLLDETLRIMGGKPTQGIRKPFANECMNLKLSVPREGYCLLTERLLRLTTVEDCLSDSSAT
jgi:hypothetical protein